MTQEYEFANTDPDDISFLLSEVEKSFDIKFSDTELMHITTFGELCDHITNKIQLENNDDCTSQQAFYKLRDAISSTLDIDNKVISRNLSLTDLLPRKSRRSNVKKIERHLGFKLNILHPPYWITGTLFIILLISIIALFIKWQIGLSGFSFSLLGFWLAIENENELDLTTVGEVVEKMTRESYFNSRRNHKTFNKKEVEKLLINWFSSELELERSQLTRETKFA